MSRAGARVPAADAAPSFLLPLSAPTAASLGELAGRYLALLAAAEPPALVDLCHTAGRDADRHDHRLAVVAGTASELRAGLTAAARAESSRSVTAGVRPHGGPAAVAFVFTGQGPQWTGMGRDLLRAEPAFAEAIEACDAAMRPHAPWRLTDELNADEDQSRLDRTEIAQPALFAVQVGLAALWREWGVEPAAVIGHSNGEIAAAFTAGVLDLESAARLALTRGRIMQATTGRGRMAAVSVDAAEGERIAAASGGLLSVAALNGPRSIIVSGDSRALERMLESLTARGIGNKSLPVDYARHSAQMEPLRDELERALSALRAGKEAIPLYSTVTGTLLDGRAMDATYWGRNLRETVRFAPAVEAAAADGIRTFLEISPSPALRWHIEELLEPFGGGRVAMSLRHRRPGRLSMLGGLGELYAAGACVRWERVQPNGRQVELPPAAPDSGGAAAEREVARIDFASLEAEARRAAIANVVRTEVATVLELPTPAQVDPAQNLFQAGVDSLMAVELKSRLERAILPSLPPTLAFSHPSVEALAAYLSETMAARASAGHPAAGNGAHAIPGASRLRPIPRGGDLPLSFGQERVWFLEQLQPESLLYNSLRRIRLSGALDAELLRRSVEAVVGRHEVLRATFPSIDGVPVERIASNAAWPMPVVDLRRLREPEREEEARRLTSTAVKTPFDLSRGPLLRTVLLRLADQEHILVLTIHHIVSDEWSINVFLREMTAFYEGFVSHAPSVLPELSIQYPDFAHWQREWLTGGVHESLRAYWAARLAGPLPLLRLPYDGRRASTSPPEGKTWNGAIDATVVRGLRDLSRREGVTLYTTLLTAVNVLLHRYSAEDDIVVGTYVSGRMRNEFDGLMGFFVNTLALRTDVSGDPTFREALARTRDVVLGAQAHADFPYERLVEELRPERNLTRSPFFQVDFNLHAHRLRSEPLASGLRIENLPFLEYHANTDELTITVFDRKDALDFTLTYNPQLFDAATVARAAGHLQVLLAGIVASPESRVSALPLLPEAERHRLLVGFNSTDTDFPDAACFPVYFEEQVRRTPHAIAVEDDEGTLSYSELNARANRVARSLVSAGIGPGVPVAVFAERSRMLLTWLIATFKAGGVYLPLDPQYPAGRHASMLLQSRAAVVLTADEMRARLDATMAAIPTASRPRVIAAAEMAPAAGRDADLEVRAHPESTAYIIFTSGSTGVPKGAMVPHRAMLNNLWSHVRGLAIARDDIVAQIAPPGFDTSIWQFLAALLVGARVRIAPDTVTSEPQLLFDLIEHERITIADVVPSVLRAYLEDRPPQAGGAAFGHLRLLVVGGETVTAEQCRDWLRRYPGTPISNGYGPTECADVVTRHLIREAPDDDAVQVPIGRPIHNVRAYVVDERLALVPLGVSGELCVGGTCVGSGYVNDPERTAAAFVADPFSTVPGARMYRTGDRARFRDDGTIEFLGRTDHQVKIRGHRIELGEIETAIAHHAAVKTVAVNVWSGPLGPRLVAYVVLADRAGDVAGSELRAHLRNALPGYMVPDSFVVLPALPLNANGKVDRRALPAPEVPAISASESPRTPAEKTIAGIWTEMLGLERLGVDDNFFELGGHSLIATRMVSRLRTVFGIDVPLRRVFELQTIAGLAASLERDVAAAAGGGRQSGAAEADEPELVRASREAYRRPARQEPA